LTAVPGRDRSCKEYELTHGQRESRRRHVHAGQRSERRRRRRLSRI
jgi:hypothetical protein